MFKLYVTQSMIVGEAIRFLASKNKITARQIGIDINMSEGNVSRLLSDGMGYKKNIDKILSAVKSDKNQLDKIVNDIIKICKDNHLDIKSELSIEPKDILIRNKELQKVINIELKACN